MNVNKKLLAWIGVAFVAAVIIGFATCSSASAREFYVKVEAGQAMDTEAGGFALGDGPVLGAAVGTAVGPLRVEGGVQRIDADTDFGIEVQADALYYNASANLDLASGFYVGAGAGYMDAEAEFGPVSFNDSGWAWHAQAGYAVRLTDRMIGEAQLRYIDGDLDTIGDVNTVVGTVGLRIRL